jgi:hypothetical protein
MEPFSPGGETREIALVTLRLVVEAILDGETTLAAALLDQVQPESLDNSVATIASCIGVALGLLDDWLSGQARELPGGLVRVRRSPRRLARCRAERDQTCPRSPHSPRPRRPGGRRSSPFWSLA